MKNMREGKYTKSNSERCCKNYERRRRRRRRKRRLWKKRRRRRRSGKKEEQLNENNYDAALSLAELPAKLRGFGHVKDRNRELLALQRDELLRRLRGDEPASAVKIVEAA